MSGRRAIAKRMMQFDLYRKRGRKIRDGFLGANFDMIILSQSRKARQESD